MDLPPAPQRTTPGFSFSIMNRALRDCIADRCFGKAEMAQIVDFFGHECAYCGGPVERWDHLAPISGGGDTVLGNIVPSCSRCDDSKRDLAFDEWATCAAPASPHSRGVTDIEARLARVHEYAGRYAYVPRSLEDRLTPEELRRFAAIQEDLARLRRDVDDFIAQYRERNGLV